MDQTALILAYDVGTTGNKTCLYRVGASIEMLASNIAEYPLYMTPDGGAEQKVEEWWQAICKSTRTILDKTGTDPARIAGIVFCCQMQGSIVVDKDGQALRNPMIYMDGRSTGQIERLLCHGLLRISGWNAFKTLYSLWVTGGLAATAKDPLWKYHWVKENEPDVFKKVHKWLDVKDYLLFRCTGQYAMTQDSAHLTFIYDTRPGKLAWHRGLGRLFDVNPAHLPPVVQATDRIGALTDRAAGEMGLSPGIPVFGGGGDTSLTAIGAGCLEPNDTHIYVGTSGWVVANVQKRMVDINNFIASILGAIPGGYNYIAEQETSGVCLQWVRDHLARDEIGVYLKDNEATTPEEESGHLYELLSREVAKTPPGAGNLIFTPWLHGNRSPREDAFARGMFFNIGLNTGTRMMVRAVLEGVAFHKRWMLGGMERKIPRQAKIRFVGGGAKSPVWCQIMADVTGRLLETVENPQDVGTLGAAIVSGVGLGLIPSFAAAKKMIPAGQIYTPQGEYKDLYDRNFEIFKALYKQNRKLFAGLNKSRSTE